MGLIRRAWAVISGAVGEVGKVGNRAVFSNPEMSRIAPPAYSAWGCSGQLASFAGRHSASFSDGFTSSAAHRLRRGFSTLLLAVALLLGLAAGAQAQTVSVSMPASANEGNAGTRNINVTVSRPGTTLVTNNQAMLVCFTGTATLSTSNSEFRTDADDYRKISLGTTQTGADFNCIEIVMGMHYPLTQMIRLQIRGDTVAERDETIIATISFVGTPSLTTWSLGTPSATHTIQNDDPMAVQLLPTSDVTFTEQTPSDTTKLTVRLERRLYAGEQLAAPIAYQRQAGISPHDQPTPSYANV